MRDEHKHVLSDHCACADVGLARLLSSAQTMASAVGTFDWAAPELLAGADAGSAVMPHAHIGPLLRNEHALLFRTL